MNRSNETPLRSALRGEGGVECQYHFYRKFVCPVKQITIRTLHRFVEMWIFLPIFLVFLQPCRTQEQDLYRVLFANYSKETRPIGNGLEPMQVIVGGFRLTAVEYLDAMTATLALNGWFNFVSLSFLKFKI